MKIPMPSLFATRALLPDGWTENVRIEIGDDGKIVSVESQVTAAPSDQNLGSGILVPAIGNLHSHTFQRAMAGMTEYRSSENDDFWSWRTLMYRFLDVLTPEDIEAIAALAFMEMLESGYASVAEFHYVHHQPGGAAYGNIAELSERIASAASDTGIGLTLLPVLYSYGGAECTPLSGGQLRFGCDLDRYSSLMEAARRAVKRLPEDSGIGVAPHSLRATSPEQFEQLSPLASGGPLHIHIAEQQREVREIEAWHGARPVEWLLDNAAIGPDWCLIHATHMTQEETAGLAASGATAGLCPITEANLGDGIFNGREFLANDGQFGTGSDSNVHISLSQELRQLEYSQRYRHEARNVLATSDKSTGTRLYLGALCGGARAQMRASAGLGAGEWADMVCLNGDHVALCGLAPDYILDGWIFAADDRVVRDVWSAGRHCIRDGAHVSRDSIERRYRKVLSGLIDRI